MPTPRGLRDTPTSTYGARRARAFRAGFFISVAGVNLGPCDLWVTVVPLQPEMSNISIEPMSDKDVLCRRWLTQIASR
jgi:hypothetical protein